MSERNEPTSPEAPFVAVGDGEDPPWGSDRTCPVCGEPDLPLRESVPPLLTFISHCGRSWVRGPINRGGNHE